MEALRYTNAQLVRNRLSVEIFPCDLYSVIILDDLISISDDDYDYPVACPTATSQSVDAD